MAVFTVCSINSVSTLFEETCFDKFTEKYADDYMDETGQYYQLHERSDIKYGNWVD